MSTLEGFDAASPPPTVPTVGGRVPQVVEVYVGGDTPHVWTVANVKEAVDAGVGYALPVFVRSNLPGPGVRSDVMSILAGFARYDWSPVGRAVLVDVETTPEAGYLLPLAAQLHDKGLKVLVYESRSTIVHNPVLDGIVDANPGKRNATVDAGMVGTQYAWDHTYDLDVFDTSIRAWLVPLQPAAKVSVPSKTPANVGAEKSPVSNPVPVVAEQPVPGNSTIKENGNMVIFEAATSSRDGKLGEGYQCVVFVDGSSVWIPSESDSKVLQTRCGEPLKVTGDFINNLINRRHA